MKRIFVVDLDIATGRWAVLEDRVGAVSIGMLTFLDSGDAPSLEAAIAAVAAVLSTPEGA